MHYAVLVLLNKELQNENEIENALAEVLSPFDENIEVEPYIECTKKEIIEKSKKIKKNILSQNKPVSSYDLAFINANTDEEFYKAYIKAYIDEDTLYDIHGNKLSTYNPNSKWDWYVIGGRCGYIPLKGGLSKEICRIKDIDFSINKKQYAKYERIWDVIVNDITPKNDEEKIQKAVNSKDWILSQFKNKEEYCRINSIFHTYAVLTSDGKWLEKSHSSTHPSSDWFQKFMDILECEDKYTIAVMVDVHI